MITRRLVCVLTEEEVLERGRQLANAEEDYGRIEREKKAAMEQFKRSLDATGGRIDTLAAAIREKSEIRDVECFVMNDNLSLQHRVIRHDTGEVIESYPFSEAERQGTLI